MLRGSRLSGRILRELRELIEGPVLGLLLPAACFVCGSPLGRRTHLGACLRCWSGFQRLKPPLCPGCGLPRPPETDLLGPARGRCAVCLVEPGPADFVRGAVVYGAVARRFLLRAKLGRHPELLRPLGDQLSAVVVGTRLHVGCTVVVPVPSHPWVSLNRGFSPALELARRVARRTGLPLVRSALAVRAFARLGSKRLGARGRRAAAGALRVRTPLPGHRVLLIDDVLTTDATAGTCARGLKLTGSHEIRVAVWARGRRGSPFR